MTAMIDIVNAEKTFTMHLQGGVQLPVVRGVSFQVEPGECVVLSGPSGAGKSSILKMIFGNYRCDRGRICIRHGGQLIDIARAEPREVLSVRRADDRLCQPVPAGGAARARARRGGGAPDGARDVARQCAGAQAGSLLRRLNIPERLWALPPSTFSGGEQQRVNIARGFISDLPILLLDEPTASLDAANRKVVVELVAEKKARRRGHGRHRPRRRDPPSDCRPHRGCGVVCIGRPGKRIDMTSTGSETVIGNARVVLADRVIERGWIAFAHGKPYRRDRRGRCAGGGEDVGGDLVMPGLIELHTDHLEAHYVPRPEGVWDPVAAVVSYDGQLATSGHYHGAGFLAGLA